MTDRADLLIELGTEELPPKALPELSRAFQEQLTAQLTGAGLTHETSQRFATPRRLAVLVPQLQLSQPPQRNERRGPSLQAAFDKDRNPTRAAQGFARSCGVDLDQLETLETDRGSWLIHRSETPGRPTRELLPSLLQRAVEELPIPKRMRWGAGSTEFVRPVHWVVALLGEDVVSLSLFGKRSDRFTRGHRFHHPGNLKITAPAHYVRILREQGQVIVDFQERLTAIRRLVTDAATELESKAVLDEDLLEEVTALVEWPVAVSGRFDERFLAVPPEALVSTMQDHQKYFPVRDDQGRLAPAFVTISNIESSQPEVVRSGNERVVRPRLADAEFFWNQDRARSLESRVPDLEHVTFQKKLGTLAEKARRVSRLAGHIAEQLGSNPEAAHRAASLCKCDLVTAMVFEFPELQGTMGRYYAANDGESPEVAAAIEQHYWPRHAGAPLPECATAQAVALADRLDTLVGIFAVGLAPSGAKDPFALRRAALGAIRICIEPGLDLDLRALIGEAHQALPESLRDPGVVPQVWSFIMDRMRGYHTDRGMQPDDFAAVAAVAPPRPTDFQKRIRAVAAFRRHPASESLTAANKRIRNILRRAGQEAAEEVNIDLLTDAAERFLHGRLHELRLHVQPMLEAGDYETALESLAELKAPVDRFFDEVMVMADDTRLRLNRLALLTQVAGTFDRIADLSKLQSPA